ncbi:hypothetical protein D3C72_2177500 [compost metagenome]
MGFEPVTDHCALPAAGFARHRNRISLWHITRRDLGDHDAELETEFVVHFGRNVEILELGKKL